MKRTLTALTFALLAATGIAAHATSYSLVAQDGAARSLNSVAQNPSDINQNGVAPNEQRIGQDSVV